MEYQILSSNRLELGKEIKLTNDKKRILKMDSDIFHNDIFTNTLQTFLKVRRFDSFVMFQNLCVSLKSQMS